LDVISSNISAGNIPKGLLNNVNNSRFLRPPKALPSICLIELLWRKRTFSGVSAKVFPGMYVILLCIIISVCMFVSPAKVRRLILEMWLKCKSLKIKKRKEKKKRQKKGKPLQHCFFL